MNVPSGVGECVIFTAGAGCEFSLRMSAMADFRSSLEPSYGALGEEGAPLEFADPRFGVVVVVTSALFSGGSVDALRLDLLGD